MCYTRAWSGFSQPEKARSEATHMLDEKSVQYDSINGKLNIAQTHSMRTCVECEQKDHAASDVDVPVRLNTIQWRSKKVLVAKADKLGLSSVIMNAAGPNAELWTNLLHG